jgi:hypothetical protein
MTPVRFYTRLDKVPAAEIYDKIVGTSKPMTLEELVRTLVQQVPPERKITVAVVGFESTSLNFQLTTALVNHKPAHVEVVSRQLIDTVLKELNFQYNDLFDEKTRKQLGNMLGVNAIVVGNQSASSIKSLGELFLIDVETAELIAAASRDSVVVAAIGPMDDLLKNVSGDTLAVIGALPSDNRSSGDSTAISLCEQTIAACIAYQKNQMKLPIKILSRFKLDQVLRELNFQNSDWVDPATTKRLGKFTGASAILVVTPAGVGDLTNLQVLDVETALVKAAQNVTLDISKTISFSFQPPVQMVYVFDYRFWIDRYEVTNAGFAAFLNTQGSHRDQNRHRWLELSGPLSQILLN